MTLPFEIIVILFKNTEANRRFEIAHKYPQLRKAENAAPLSIERLKLESGEGPHIMTINDTKYSTGTIRSYTEGIPVPLCHEHEKENGGVGYQINNYGFCDYDAQFSSTDGDVILGNRSRANEETQRFYWERWDRHIQEERKYYTSRLQEDPDFQDEPSLIKISQMEETIQSFHNRTRGVSVPYKRMAQLTIESPNGEKIVKKSQKSLYECEKKLLTRLFGNRKIINVKLLDIDCDFMNVRFPPNMKMRVQELSLNNNCLSTDPLYQIIDTSSQIKKLILKRAHLNIRRSPLFKDIEMLVINANHIWFGYNEFIEITIRNVEYRDPPSEDIQLTQLINNWRTNNQPIGTKWKFIMSSGREVIRPMKDVKSNLDVIEVAFNRLIIRLDCIRTVEVSYDASDVDAVWILKLEIVSTSP